MNDPNKQRRDDALREENHGMLLQMRNSIGNLETQVSTFIAAQSDENRRMHGRIDAQGESLNRAVGSIKDTIAERSRVTPSLIAMVLSSIAILGGAGTAYIGLQTAPIKTDVSNVANEQRAMETQRLLMRQDLVALQIKTAAEDAKQAEAHRWEEKLLDEVRRK